jgi:hypothetical protein
METFFRVLTSGGWRLNIKARAPSHSVNVWRLPRQVVKEKGKKYRKEN